MPPARPQRQDSNSRLEGLALTLLLHAALVAGWQQARKIRLPVKPEPDFVQRVKVPARLPETAPQAAPKRRRAPAGPGADSGVSAACAGAARQMIEQAMRDAGAMDRAVRRDSKPTIVAPPDSPQIRRANKFREAAALAPNKWYEAPRIVELVNDGGDGARRFRVLTALGIYCITERSPATSIDRIKKTRQAADHELRPRTRAGGQSPGMAHGARLTPGAP